MTQLQLRRPGKPRRDEQTMSWAGGRQRAPRHPALRDPPRERRGHPLPPRREGPAAACRSQTLVSARRCPTRRRQPAARPTRGRRGSPCRRSWPQVRSLHFRRSGSPCPSLQGGRTERPRRRCPRPRKRSCRRARPPKRWRRPPATGLRKPQPSWPERSERPVSPPGPGRSRGSTSTSERRGQARIGGSASPGQRLAAWPGPMEQG